MDFLLKFCFFQFIGSFIYGKKRIALFDELVVFYMNMGDIAADQRRDRAAVGKDKSIGGKWFQMPVKPVDTPRADNEQQNKK